MASETIELTYSGSVAPKKTKHLTPNKISIEVMASIEVDGSDVRHAKTIQAEFVRDMRKRVSAQARHLDTWIKEREEIVAGMVRDYQALKAAPFPTDLASATGRGERLRELALQGLAIKALTDEYEQIVADWGTNVQEQQSLIAAQAAVKKARVKTFKRKAFRVRAGQVTKGVLVVAGIALGIAAIVVSAGTAAPAVTAVAAAGLALAGLGSVAKFSKAIVADYSVEKKILKSVQADVAALEAAFKPTEKSSKNIQRHVAELQNLMRMRGDKITELEHEMATYKPAITKWKQATAALAKTTDETLDAATVAQFEEDGKSAAAAAKVVATKITALKKDNGAAEQVVRELEDLGVVLEGLRTAPLHTVAGNLRERYSTADGWFDLATTVGGLTKGTAKFVG